MAFSFRKVFSNIPYFKRGQSDAEPEIPGESGGVKRRHSSVAETLSTQEPFQETELNLSSRRYASSVKKVSEPIKYFSARKNSLSDTDLFNTESPCSKKDRRKTKKLRLDIEKANKSADDGLDLDNPYANYMIENTPKQISLGFKENIMSDSVMRQLEMEKSMDIFEFSDISSSPELDIESLSEESDSDSNANSKTDVKMCRKVSVSDDKIDCAVVKKIHRSLSVDSFSDVECDRNEEERVTLLLSYQMKLEKIERFLKKLLTEFQFHIEVSKVFNCKSFLTTLPGSDVSNLPKILGEITHIDNVSRGASPSGSWNIVMEKDDTLAKLKLRKQLLSMKSFIEEFVDVYLHTRPLSVINNEAPTGNSTLAEKDLKQTPHAFASVDKPQPVRKAVKKIRINRRKYEKRLNDFPDLREILQNLFKLDGDKSMSINASVSANNVTPLISDSEITNISQCTCNCPVHNSTASIKSTDSGLPTKQSDTITSSIGDFTLDTTTLTAYSESLDQVISYNSYNDSSLISSMLQKSAIERITFYVQVHGIQMASEQDTDDSIETRITFGCQACRVVDITDEQGLLLHILGQAHCEKIHFLYKTAYIKRCLATGNEIQPSTVLNSMTMYRDDNKIVCFGDSKFACSLCFESSIVGESMLMAHCNVPDHVEKRNWLDEIME